MRMSIMGKSLRGRVVFGFKVEMLEKIEGAWCTYLSRGTGSWGWERRQENYLSEKISPSDGPKHPP